MMIDTNNNTQNILFIRKKCRKIMYNKLIINNQKNIGLFIDKYLSS